MITIENRWVGRRIFGAVVVLALVLGMAESVSAKMSDGNNLFRQVENMKNAIEKCKLDVGPLNEIRSKSVAGGVLSGLSTVASGTATVASAVALSEYGKKETVTGKEGKNEDVDWSATNTKEKLEKMKSKNDKLNSSRIVSTVASGIAAGTNTTTLTLSATSTAKLADLMNATDDCVRALDDVDIDVPGSIY